MTGLPVPKYAIGDVVFEANTHETSTARQCPDCQGLKRWTVTTPAGEIFTVPCQRCDRQMELPSLYERTWTPSTKQLTIGQVNIQHPPRTDWANEEPVRYMCAESGIGSGRVYNESQLFAIESEAMESARRQCVEAETKWRNKPEVLYRDSVARLHFRDAHSEQAASSVWKAHYHHRQLADAIEEQLGRDDEGRIDRDSLRDALNSDEWHMDGQQNPIVALVLAARGVTATAELSAALEAFAYIREKTVEVADGF